MIIIPDVHGRDFWKSAVKGREDEEIIFLGDYVDPYTNYEGIKPSAGMECLLEIIAFKQLHAQNVTLLLGNHDLSYLSSYLVQCRHDYDNHDTIRTTLLDNLALFSLAHEKTIAGRHYIFTHAGILPAWLKENERILGKLAPENAVEKLNEGLASGDIYAALGDVSFYRGGHLDVGSCVWADVSEHKSNAARFYREVCEDEHPLESMWADVFQIFGHTQQVGGRPVVSPFFACLDCRKAFTLADDGNLKEIVGVQ